MVLLLVLSFVMLSCLPARSKDRDRPWSGEILFFGKYGRAMRCPSERRSFEALECVTTARDNVRGQSCLLNWLDVDILRLRRKWALVERIIAAPFFYAHDVLKARAL